MSYEERLGRAVLELTTDRRQFDQGIRHAHREAKGLDSQFQRTGASLQEVATRALALGAIAFSTSRFVSGIISARLELERIENTLRSVAGSQRAAAAEMDFISREADRLGLPLAAAAGEYAKLSAAAKGTRLEGQGARDIFVAVSEAATVLGLSADQTSGALNAIQQMISKGTVAAEELRGQLGERLPGAFQIAARSMGVTTQELGQMLQRGEVMAEDLLPRLAVELRRAFGGEVETAAASLRAEINRLSTAWLMFRDAVSQSGVADATAESAGFFARMLEGAAVLIKGVQDAERAMAEAQAAADLPGQQQRVQELTERHAELRRAIERNRALAADGNLPAGYLLEVLREDAVEVREELTKAQEALAEMRRTAGADVSGQTPPGISPQLDIAGPAPPLDMLRTTLDFSTEEDETRKRQARRAALELEREAAALYEQTRTPLERYVATIAAYREHLEDGRITQDTFNRGVEQAGDAFRQASEDAADASSQMEQYALQASRNMQSAFADFLFDPFDDGLEGMLSSFANTMRRMAAEAAAAQILGSGAGDALTAGISSLFGGFRANGGPVSAGKAYVVGERGPELLFMGGSGHVSPNGAGSTHIEIVDQRGAQAPPVSVERSQFQDREAIRVLIEPEVLSIMGSRNGRAITRSRGAR